MSLKRLAKVSNCVDLSKNRFFFPHFFSLKYTKVIQVWSACLGGFSFSYLLLFNDRLNVMVVWYVHLWTDRAEKRKGKGCNVNGGKRQQNDPVKL